MLYTVLLYPQMVGFDARMDGRKRVATATTHTIRILLVCGAVLRLAGSHGLSAVRIARAAHRPTVPRQRRSSSVRPGLWTLDARDWRVDGFSTSTLLIIIIIHT